MKELLITNKLNANKEHNRAALGRRRRNPIAKSGEALIDGRRKTGLKSSKNRSALYTDEQLRAMTVSQLRQVFGLDTELPPLRLGSRAPAAHR